MKARMQFRYKIEFIMICEFGKEPDVFFFFPIEVFHLHVLAAHD